MTEENKSNGAKHSFTLHKAMKLFNSERFINLLAEEVGSLNMTYSINDLGCFRQSPKFSDMEEELANKPAIKAFIKHMKTKVRQYVEKKFNFKSAKEITMTASEYRHGDYLLCHDDMVGTRYVAFVYYLTDSNWDVEIDGGALRFFDHERTSMQVLETYCAEIEPERNSLVLFTVNEISHHEVQQVFSRYKPRLSINGWFHSSDRNNEEKRKAWLASRNWHSDSPVFQFDSEPPLSTDYQYHRVINNIYFMEEVQEKLTEIIKSERSVCCVGFLEDDFYSQVSYELTNKHLEWKTRGPVDHRFYETLEVNLDENEVCFSSRFSLVAVRYLIDFLISDLWLSTLNTITGLDFMVLSEDKRPPLCLIEVRRFREGHYSLLADDDINVNMSSIEVNIFFEVNTDLLESYYPEVGPPVGCVVHSIKHLQLTPESFTRTLTSKRKKVTNCRPRYNVMSKVEFEKEKTKLWEQKRNYTRESILDLRPYKKNKSEATITKVNNLVQKKMDALVKYRKDNDIQNSIIYPSTNSMLLTINSKQQLRYTSRLKQRSPSLEPGVAYFAVSVTYFAIDERNLTGLDYERVDRIVPPSAVPSCSSDSSQQSTTLRIQSNRRMMDSVSKFTGCC